MFRIFHVTDKDREALSVFYQQHPDSSLPPAEAVIVAVETEGICGCAGLIPAEGAPCRGLLFPPLLQPEAKGQGFEQAMVGLLTEDAKNLGMTEVIVPLQTADKRLFSLLGFEERGNEMVYDLQKHLQEVIECIRRTGHPPVCCSGEHHD